MVDKKTTKKGAVKASGKNPASAKKPVNASADPAAAGSVHCVDREYILPDISIDTEVYKRVLSCDDMHKFPGMARRLGDKCDFNSLRVSENVNMYRDLYTANYRKSYLVSITAPSSFIDRLMFVDDNGELIPIIGRLKND